MGRSHKVSVRIHQDVWDDLQEDLPNLPYADFTEYLNSVILHERLVNRPHSLTVEIVQAKPSEQDLIYRGLKNVRAERTGRLTWLEHRICEAVWTAFEADNIDDLKAKLAAEIVEDPGLQIIKERLSQVIREHLRDAGRL